MLCVKHWSISYYYIISNSITIKRDTISLQVLQKLLDFFAAMKIHSIPTYYLASLKLSVLCTLCNLIITIMWLFKFRNTK